MRNDLQEQLDRGAIAETNVQEMLAIERSLRLQVANLTRNLTEARAEVLRLTHFRDGLAVTVTQLEAQNERLRAALRAETERCAMIAAEMPPTILQMWDRPGGPPGNGYRPIAGPDIAAAIRASASRDHEQEQPNA